MSQSRSIRIGRPLCLDAVATRLHVSTPLQRAAVATAGGV
jgi:hypothetical protein